MACWEENHTLSVLSIVPVFGNVAKYTIAALTTKNRRELAFKAQISLKSYPM
jgi:hypothetical protein